MVARKTLFGGLCSLTYVQDIAAIDYRRLNLPVNARAKNMFLTDVKRLCFRCQTLKFPRPNLRDLKRLCFRCQTLEFHHTVIFAGFSRTF